MHLGVEEEIAYTRISEYELDKAEPTLMSLTHLFRLAGVNTEALIDDELNLPDKLPGPINHEQIKRAYTTRRKTR